MTQLAALTLTKKQLDQIPDDERLFYFMAGQLHNDINILTNLLAVAINEGEFVSREPPKRIAAEAQLLLLLKLTAGRLYEGQKMINETFSKNLRNKYRADMSSATLESLDKLNKYFASKNKFFESTNAIHHIRRKFAFHLDAELIKTAYASAPPEFASVTYLSKIPGHNLFGTSERLSFIAIVGDGRENWEGTIDQVVEDITEICLTLRTFLMGFIGIIFNTHLGLTKDHLEAVEITITDDPSIDDVRLPFFCLPPQRAG